MLVDKNIMQDAVRPFKTVEKMNAAFIRSCNSRGKIYTDKNGAVIDRDTIIHLGDFACWKSDRGHAGLEVNPQSWISQIGPQFINLRGNHDDRNKVKSVCDSMRTTLGRRFTAVSMSHYPSFDPRAKGQFLKGDIHLCGHVHGKWKYKIDYTNSVLNVNVGVDVWNYQIVSEDELIAYLNKILSRKA